MRLDPPHQTHQQFSVVESPGDFKSEPSEPTWISGQAHDLCYPEITSPALNNLHLGQVQVVIQSQEG